jgi:uncharacterized membrane-anchored protein
MLSIRGLHGTTTVAVAAMVLIVAAAARAGAQSREGAPPIDWQYGPSLGKLGRVALITVPAGYRFTGPGGARKLLELLGHHSGGDELGALVPNARYLENVWYVVFRFYETGYVRDDDLNALNPDDLLKGIRHGEKEVVWEQQPSYNRAMHRLTYAVRFSNGEETVNYSTWVLGRRGIMCARLVVSAQKAALVIPAFQGLMRGLSYQDAERYSEFVEGDKIADQGLAALVSGGGPTAKSLLESAFVRYLLRKLLLPVLLAIGGAIAWFWRRLFGGRERAGRY